MNKNLKSFMEEPWWVITDNMAEKLNSELHRELSQNHILYGTRAIAVARRVDNDAVVYWINELNKFAVVHLTYCKENSSSYPGAELYTLEELEKHCKHVSNFY